MTTVDLGPCETFVYELRRSGLIERGQLDQVLEDYMRKVGRPDPDSLAGHLISQGLLTKFQADRIGQGKSQGLVLGPYVLTESVGSGSMGSVHKAQSKNDGNWYALKVLPRRSMWNVRLARRQVRVFSQFSHPTVVPFVDVGTSGGLHYLVWSFAEGESLEAIVQRVGKLEPAEAAHIGAQIATGLALAHQNGVFHGLLKPSNIMISPSGQVSILDFGIGSLLAENEGESLVDTMSTANALTSGLDCSSPESIMEPTNRTPAGDQYSLGCVLYYCLAGQYPFADGSAVEKMMAHQFKQPTPLTDLAPGTPGLLAAVVERLLQKKPEDRYPSVDECLEKLAPMGNATALAHRLGRPKSSARHATILKPRESNHAAPMPAGQSPDVTPAGPMTPRALPTRQSMRAELPGQEAPVPPSRQSIAAVPPSRQPNAAGPPSRQSVAAIPQSRQAVAAVPSSRASYVALPANVDPATGEVVEETGSRPALGPIGFLALGAAVAVACFIVVMNLMK